eukprot:362470-Hanusia_phi.AAC.1
MEEEKRKAMLGVCLEQWQRACTGVKSVILRVRIDMLREEVVCEKELGRGEKVYKNRGPVQHRQGLNTLWKEKRKESRTDRRRRICRGVAEGMGVWGQPMVGGGDGRVEGAVG